MPMSLCRHCRDAAAWIMVLFACRRAGQDQTKTGSGSGGQVDSLKEKGLLTSPQGRLLMRTWPSRYHPARER